MPRIDLPVRARPELARDKYEGPDVAHATKAFVSRLPIVNG